MSMEKLELRQLIDVVNTGEGVAFIKLSKVKRK
jgi:hypothetical protein